MAGIELCERAMKTLLESYIGERSPLEGCELSVGLARAASTGDCQVVIFLIRRVGVRMRAWV